MKSKDCPVFHPTAEEFKNFEKYMEYVEQVSSGYGMAKIIPPKGWKARKQGYDTIKAQVTHPVRQIVSGLAGIYQVILLSEPAMTYEAYKNYSTVHNLPDSLTTEEIERTFWKTIRYSPPIYGADSDTNSLFDPTSSWNLSNLPGLLDKGLSPLKLKGINTSFLYFGMWKSMFCWHKEDLDLYSINYLHFGKPKIWYCIPSADSEKFERLCQFNFTEEYEVCKEFLRHKSTQISPSTLKAAGIKFHRAEHKAGEFMVIFSKCYHMGFNTGFNCAEAVNFALKQWVKHASQVKRCLCDPEAVQIDMEAFRKNLDQRKGKGRPRKRAKVDEDYNL